MSSPNRRTILVVDDEPDLRELLTNEFENHDFRVIEAADGQVARRIIESQPVDFVVSDIRMPEGDGITLLREIGNLPPPRPPFLFITGFEDFPTHESYHLGASAVLLKPFDLSELLATVERNLRRRAERWQAPPDSASHRRGVLEIELDSIDSSAKPRTFALGLGGFYIGHISPHAILGQELDFRIRFREGPVSMLEGCGIVRWTRGLEYAPLPPGMGIELRSLSNETREVVLSQIDQESPLAFIPKS